MRERHRRDAAGLYNLASLHNAEPGALVAAPSRKALCHSWPNTTEVTVSGHHFVPEESPVELTRALARWIATLP